jgi:hypothetical protein
MSTVKEESKKLDLNYAMTTALDGIASEAKKVYISAASSRPTMEEKSQSHSRAAKAAKQH